MISSDTSFRYSDRTGEMYQRAAEYILKFASGKRGNYLVFFSSYKMLGDIGACLKEKLEQQVEELTDRLKRNMAEFDNFRKRTEKEKAMMYNTKRVRED